MRMLTSRWVVLPGSLLIVVGMAGCRAGGSQRTGQSLLGDRGGPGTASETVISREPNANPYPAWNSQDSNGYLQPMPAPPSDDSDSHVPPSPLSRRENSKGRPRPLAALEQRGVAERQIVWNDEESGANSSAMPAEPVDAQRRLLPANDQKPGVMQRMGDGFSNFMDSLSGSARTAQQAAAAKKQERQEKRLAERLPETHYEPFVNPESTLVQTMGESTPNDNRLLPSWRLPITRPAPERNPVQLGLPEAF
ncbi:MAG: hypothetical protein AB7O26_18780 [Planctomycetaceae bacterium]